MEELLEYLGFENFKLFQPLPTLSAMQIHVSVHRGSPTHSESFSMSGKFTPETRSSIVCLGDALADQVPPSRGTKTSCFQNLYR